MFGWRIWHTCRRLLFRQSICRGSALLPRLTARVIRVPRRIGDTGVSESAADEPPPAGGALVVSKRFSCGFDGIPPAGGALPACGVGLLDDSASTDSPSAPSSSGMDVPYRVDSANFGSPPPPPRLWLPWSGKLSTCTLHCDAAARFAPAPSGWLLTAPDDGAPVLQIGSPSSADGCRASRWFACWPIGSSLCAKTSEKALPMLCSRRSVRSRSMVLPGCGFGPRAAAGRDESTGSRMARSALKEKGARQK
jgi:hypothetical protein